MVEFLLATLGDAKLDVPTVEVEAPASQVHASNAPIAVVGVGMRLPGGVEDLDSFWRLLSEGREAVEDVPHERIDLSRPVRR